MSTLDQARELCRRFGHPECEAQAVALLRANPDAAFYRGVPLSAMLEGYTEAQWRRDFPADGPGMWRGAL